MDTNDECYIEHMYCGGKCEQLKSWVFRGEIIEQYYCHGCHRSVPIDEVIEA